MGNAMTNQGATPREDAAIGEEGEGLAAYWPHHRGVKIDEVGVAAGKMLVIVDTMGIVADRARRPAASHYYVGIVSTTTTCDIFFERGVA